MFSGLLNAELLPTHWHSHTHATSGECGERQQFVTLFGQHLVVYSFFFANWFLFLQFCIKSVPQFSIVKPWDRRSRFRSQTRNPRKPQVYQWSSVLSTVAAWCRGSLRLRSFTAETWFHGELYGMARHLSLQHLLSQLSRAIFN